MVGDRHADPMRGIGAQPIQSHEQQYGGNALSHRTDRMGVDARLHAWRGIGGRGLLRIPGRIFFPRFARRQLLEGGLHQQELPVRIRISRIAIGMPPLGSPPIGALDLRQRRPTRDAQSLVWIIAFG